MQTDVVVIGSGIGGATCAVALAASGANITILERGKCITDKASAARDVFFIFKNGTFQSEETWETPTKDSFRPGNYYYVGGNSKLFGAVFFRYRAEDFRPLEHSGGVSPGWPISYDAFEPWYQAAEEMYQVRGASGPDTTEPYHSGGYLYPPVANEPAIEDVAQRLRRAGVTPAHLPLGVDIDAWLAGGQTGWDAFPNTGTGKKDAESVAIAQALQHPNVTLQTDCKVTRLIEGKLGRIAEVEYLQQGVARRISGKTVILSAGAVNSAVLLLKSSHEGRPKGLANRSDQVGRNFMNHNCTAIIALHPFRKNPSVYQKTLYFNDFYFRGGAGDAPLGNVQLLGKITGPILQSNSKLPAFLANWIVGRSVDWYAMSEDLPNPESRVTLRGDRIVLDWRRSNWNAHLDLVKRTKQVLRKAGYPVLLSRAFDRTVPSHQCGTTRFGMDPRHSVLDPFCRSHDHSNLFVVDAGFLPNSAAVNPALTIAAQALRVADHIKKKDFVA